MMSTHSRWIDPISRSAKSFCQGEAMRGGILVREQGISACQSQSHRRMRFLVHKRTFAPQKATSALPPKADIPEPNRLFHGTAEQRRRHGETEHSGGLRIDDQQLRRLDVSCEPVMADLVQ